MTRPFAALGAGLSLVFAFAPYNFWPLAIASPLALLAILRGCSVKQATLIGWCYGLGMFGYGVWWLQVSIHQFGVPFYVFSVSITALFIAGMALYPAAFAALWVRSSKNKVNAIGLAPGLWVLLELVRGWLFTGFPWLALGYSQLDSPTAGFAPIVGVYGCSLVVSFQAACVYEGAFAKGRRRFVAVVLFAISLVTGFGLSQLDYTTARGEPLDAALIQGAVPQELKWRRDLRAATIALYRQLSNPHWDADVVIWPETAVPAFPHEVEEILTALSAEALSNQTSLLIGMPTGEPWHGAYFNSVLGLGRHDGRYDKRHLVPFGEFFPLKDWLGGIAMLLDIPLSDFSAGDARQASLQVAGHSAGISICYEDAFGREVSAALPAAAFLINVSNDAWFGDTLAPHQHLQIARMRALETERYLLRATNTGITAVINHHGVVEAQAEAFVETALRAPFQPRGGATPYVNYGDTPVLVIALLMIAFSVFRARAQAK